MTNTPNRRRIMRIQLGTPIVTKIGRDSVALLDVSASGARIQHALPLVRGKQVKVSFTYEGTKVDIDSTVVRCKLERNGEKVGYVSGLQFVDREDGSLEVLRDIIAAAVASDFEARRAHLAGAAT